MQELVSAIRSVYMGEAIFDLRVAGKILYRQATGNSNQAGGLGQLNDRQIQILKLVARGYPNKQVASELAISERTVQTHMINIFRKLGVDSRTKAVTDALRNGWLTLDDLP